MTKIKTPTTVKNETRTAVFETLRVALANTYGTENVFRIGDTELAVKVANAPTGEPIYATFAPTIKDYADRVTKTKTIKAYDLTAEVEVYERKVAERNAKSVTAKAVKAEKIKADKARREANAKAKAERAKVKADTLTEFKRRKQVEDVNVIVKE